MKNNLWRLKRSELYTLFQRKPLYISEKELAQYLERSRFDARLLEVVTEFIRDFWWNLDPIYLNFYCKKQKSPFVVKCVCASILEFCEADVDVRKKFIDWMLVACRGIAQPSPQLFLVDGYALNSKRIQTQIKNTIVSFKKNNVFYADIPFNKGQAKKIADPNAEEISGVSRLDFVKSKAVQRIKALSHQYKNSELIEQIGINRLFLSKVLNNKFENISAEYLWRSLKKNDDLLFKDRHHQNLALLG